MSCLPRFYRLSFPVSVYGPKYSLRLLYKGVDLWAESTVDDAGYPALENWKPDGRDASAVKDPSPMKCCFQENLAEFAVRHSYATHDLAFRVGPIHA